MTTLHERNSNDGSMKIGDESAKQGRDRRQHRRHDLEPQGIAVHRTDGARHTAEFGRLVDISAGGVRIRTEEDNVKADHQIRVRLTLPSYAGICPFVDTSGAQPKPKREWIGWMTVSRVFPMGGKQVEIAGRLVDMEDMDRGMLGLYLSTQPLAA